MLLENRISFWDGKKTLWVKEKMLVTMFSEGFFFRVIESWDCVVKVEMTTAGQITLEACWYNIQSTAAVASWLENLPRELGVVGSILGCDTPKSLKLVVTSSFPPWFSGLWE